MTRSDYENVEPRLNITTYAEGLGGTHYYARLHIARSRFGRKLSWDAEWRIDQASADIMNAKDNVRSGSRLWKLNDTCYRFNTEDAARKAGLELAKWIWGTGKEILIGDEYESEPERVTLE